MVIWLYREVAQQQVRLQFLSQKFNVKCDSDLYGKFKKILRSPHVDHSENIISGLIRDTLYLRDYDHPYFTFQECNDILQFMCCQRVPKFTRHALCLIFFLYIYVALYKLYVLFCVCLFVLLQSLFYLYQ